MWPYNHIPGDNIQHSIVTKLNNAHFMHAPFVREPPIMISFYHASKLETTFGEKGGGSTSQPPSLKIPQLVCKKFQGFG
jgi:hypothetical protein